MCYKIFKIVKRIIFAVSLIYSYDVLVSSSAVNIPINFINVSLVSVFGVFAMICLICFSFVF